MSNWPEFYKGRLLSEDYLAYYLTQYNDLFKNIYRWVGPGEPLVEIGCGIGTTTKLLVRHSGPYAYRYHCFDLDPRMCRMARFNLDGRVPVSCRSAMMSTGVISQGRSREGVVHSMGMLEHFSDEGVREVIAMNRLDGFRAAIHYVPGDLHKEPSYGDERLMSVEDWRRIADPTYIIEFNKGRDYVLVWRFTS